MWKWVWHSYQEQKREKLATGKNFLTRGYEIFNELLRMVEHFLTRKNCKTAELVANLEWLSQSCLVAADKEVFPAACGCSEMDSGTQQIFSELSFCARSSRC